MQRPQTWDPGCRGWRTTSRTVTHAQDKPESGPEAWLLRLPPFLPRSLHCPSSLSGSVQRRPREQSWHLSPRVLALRSAVLCAHPPSVQGNHSRPHTLYLQSKLWQVKANDNKHIDRSSASLVIRETQVKTTMRSHFTLCRMAFINKSTNSKCWRGCGEKATLLHCWWECKLVQTQWKRVWRFLRKLK